ncbi:hypothetical protein CDL15_Pgr027635 [Punica granatum]|uniref:Uncharacterized protein n=1 Tax=Punica granatum TaxID=22663 RepID=A0A218XJ66_PUNGR|nr:hypothetical protein CDL15_Pgr027635 [Punica granatum]
MESGEPPPCPPVTTAFHDDGDRADADRNCRWLGLGSTERQRSSAEPGRVGIETGDGESHRDTKTGRLGFQLKSGTARARRLRTGVRETQP